MVAHGLIQGGEPGEQPAVPTGSNPLAAAIEASAWTHEDVIVLTNLAQLAVLVILLHSLNT